MKKKTKLKFYHGLLLFALEIIIFIFVCVPLQLKFGMVGVALTQLILLCIAVIPVVVSGNSIKEVFPVKKVKLRQIFAIPLFWAASLILNFVVSINMTYFFPDQTSQTNQGLGGMFTSVPLIISYLIIAIMPGICEEALHRGFIQYSMRGIKNKWILVFVIGLIFGIFHLDPVRFLSTAVLGAFLGYIMIETGNIILPALFHILNNSFSVIMTFITADHEVQSTSLNFAGYLSSLGVFVLLCALVPVLLLFGSKLLHTKEYNLENKVKRKKVNIATAITSPVLVVLGIVLITVGGLKTMSAPSVLSASNSISFTEMDKNEHSFSVDKSGTYTLTLNIKADGFLTDFVIFDENDKPVYQNTATELTLTGNVDLPEGNCKAVIYYITDKESMERHFESMGYDMSSEFITGLEDIFTEQEEYSIEYSINIK